MDLRGNLSKNPNAQPVDLISISCNSCQTILQSDTKLCEKNHIWNGKTSCTFSGKSKWNIKFGVEKSMNANQGICSYLDT